MVNSVDRWLSNQICLDANRHPFTCSYRNKISIAGAIDIEEFKGAGDHDKTKAWVNAYADTTPFPYYNYGECSNCPHDDSDYFPQSAYNDYIWYVSWGVRNAYVIPEIYARDRTNAIQWRNLSRYAVRCQNCLPAQQGFSVRIYFSGAFTQWQRCQENPDKCKDENGNLVTDNTPAAGWTQLFNEVNDSRYPYIHQAVLRWSTDVAFQK